MAPYVGRPLKRFEDPRLVTGQGSFVDDLRLPGMLHALVLRSPHAHARILSLDAAPARALPGVAAVLTASDIAGAVRDIPPRPTRELEGLQVPEHPVLARDKVCYVGQPVAVVVAPARVSGRLRTLREQFVAPTRATGEIWPRRPRRPSRLRGGVT